MANYLFDLNHFDFAAAAWMSMKNQIHFNKAYALLTNGFIPSGEFVVFLLLKHVFTAFPVVTNSSIRYTIN